MDEPQTENLNLSTGQLKGFEFKESFCLVVMTGPGKGAVHNLGYGQTTLGRSERTDLPVIGKGISRVHATLLVENGSVTLVDNGSTNGVFVQGLRVKEKRLFPGDVFGLGPELKVRLESTDGGLHELIEEMYRSSKIDALTNLLNRRAFEERMDEEFSVTRRHGLVSCLAILDIDHFKSINDNYGHPAGDRVLQEVARRLGQATRQSDLIGRYGGEEFIVCLSGIQPGEAASLVEKLRAQVSTERIPGDDLEVTASAGFAVYPSHARNMEMLIRYADQALYEAKRRGRNRTVAW
ncbi:MAG: diguanylate cyclase, partial [Candidatus Eremiobacteraeota bacterium]|nr:diguanylate cyclase [Candidatus Eremiobacteraeota bacterium]